jgi:hypothetical protein
VTDDSAEKWLPLSTIRLTLQLGSRAFERQSATLFAQGLAERIPWNCFPDVPDPAGGSPLLKLQAKAADGNFIEGAAFVDQPLLLTSDPVHRSAWRATLAILDREGLPEASDLACVFHLVQDMFESSADLSGNEATSVPASARRPREDVDKTPFWPPVSAGFVPRHLHTGREQTVRRMPSQQIALRPRFRSPPKTSGHGQSSIRLKVIWPPHLISRRW